MKKQVVKSNTTPTTHKRDLSPNVFSASEIIKRELKTSIKLSLFGIYSVGLFLLGGSYLGSRQLDTTGLQEERVKLEKTQNELRNFISELKQNSKPDRWIRENNKILEQSIVDTIRSREGSKDLTISEQKDKIYELRNLLEKKIMGMRALRAPGSQKGKTLSYSYENLSIVQYEHNLQIKRFKQKQSETLGALITVLDLENGLDQKKLESFKDMQKLDLFAYRKKLETERSNFRKKKFIILK